MNRLATIAIGFALAAGSAYAAPCRDKATGKVIKCPAPAAATAMADAKSDAAADVRADAMPSASTAPVCKVGKPCGKSCIAKDKICHKT